MDLEISELNHELEFDPRYVTELSDEDLSLHYSICSQNTEEFEVDMIINGFRLMRPCYPSTSTQLHGKISRMH
jgi:hypothetical protein